MAPRSLGALAAGGSAWIRGLKPTGRLWWLQSFSDEYVKSGSQPIRGRQVIRTESAACQAPEIDPAGSRLRSATALRTSASQRKSRFQGLTST